MIFTHSDLTICYFSTPFARRSAKGIVLEVQSDENLLQTNLCSVNIHPSMIEICKQVTVYGMHFSECS